MSQWSQSSVIRSTTQKGDWLVPFAGLGEKFSNERIHGSSQMLMEVPDPTR